MVVFPKPGSSPCRFSSNKLSATTKRIMYAQGEHMTQLVIQSCQGISGVRQYRRLSGTFDAATLPHDAKPGALATKQCASPLSRPRLDVFLRPIQPHTQRDVPFQRPRETCERRSLRVQQEAALRKSGSDSKEGSIQLRRFGSYSQREMIIFQLVAGQFATPWLYQALD